MRRACAPRFWPCSAQIGPGTVGELAPGQPGHAQDRLAAGTAAGAHRGVQKRVDEGFADIADHHALNSRTPPGIREQPGGGLNDAVGVELLQGVKWTPQTLQGPGGRHAGRGRP